MLKDTVFQRIMKPITKELMNECTTRYGSDYHCEKFTTFEHLQTMVYAQLTEIKSLRTLEVAINSQQIGIKNEIKRSTLSDANSRRSAECFFWILEHLMSQLSGKLRKDLNKFIKVLDSSPIQLKGKGYNQWAKQFATTRCQGLKLHVEYDLQLNTPTRFAMSHPNYNDSSMGKRWPIEGDTVYIFDKGYYDFNWCWSIHQKRSFFVTRLKSNAGILMQTQQEAKSGIILEDGLFKFKNKHPRGGKKNLYEENLRRISVERKGKDPLILVTNLFDCAAETIAQLYKARWEIELFFKWIKQNLKLKKFLGKSPNAVKIQLATALIAYVLLQIFKDITADNRRLQLILTWAKFNLQVIDPKASYHSPPIYSFSPLSLINRGTVQL